MNRRQSVPSFLGLLAAVAAFAAESPVHVEGEPNGFTVPVPMHLGDLGPDGLILNGSLSSTHPSGLAPGDDDGFTFTVQEEWEGLALDLTGPADVPFLLTLAEEGTEGVTLLASRLQRPPLRVHVPGPAAGRTLRAGVAAFADGPPVAYTLAVSSVGPLPLWSGAPCETRFPSAEPDDDAFSPGDLGDFDRTLCGEGVLDTMPDPESGMEGDVDHFQFRNLLPVPAQLVVRADPGEVRVDVERFIFIGRATVAASSFGEEVVLLLPRLSPGETILVRIAAVRGEGPLGYEFHVEPVADTPEGDATGLENLKGRVRLAGSRPGFRLTGTYQPALVPPVPPGGALLLRIGDEEIAVAEGALTADSTGRLRWKGSVEGSALSGIDLIIDPIKGRIRVRGSGVPLQFDATSLRLDVQSVPFLVGGEAPVEPKKNGKVMKVSGGQ